MVLSGYAANRANGTERVNINKMTKSTFKALKLQRIGKTQHHGKCNIKQLAMVFYLEVYKRDLKELYFLLSHNDPSVLQ